MSILLYSLTLAASAILGRVLTGHDLAVANLSFLVVVCLTLIGLVFWALRSGEGSSGSRDPSMFAMVSTVVALTPIPGPSGQNMLQAGIDLLF